MRIAYLDCFAGIAGDMLLGALIDAGVPAKVLEDAAAALDVGASLKIETVDRSGISATKVHVLEDGALAERKQHSHAHEHGESAAEAVQHQAELEYSPQPRTQHLHKAGHKHEHGHEHSHDHDDDHAQTHAPAHSHAHAHGRSLSRIRALIGDAPLAAPVKELALQTFELLGHAEAKIHNVPVEEIHFHEVGAVDAIVDIVAASAGIHHLQIGAWYASAVNVGGGTVECAHGTFPVPAPATADLLRGVPTYSAHVQKELVTPTGAALLRALNPVFGQQPAMRVEAIGYGAGTRNPSGFPNVLRLSIGEAEILEMAAKIAQAGQQEEAKGEGQPAAELIAVLETALDDASPQLLAYVAEKALADGALDVMLTPVIMKKGRPGTLLTLLCAPAEVRRFEQMLLRETPTLGVRLRQDRRVCLERRHATVETAFGQIRVKIGSDAEGERNAAPEYEDCRAAASEHGVPLKLVQQEALAAYRRQAVR